MARPSALGKPATAAHLGPVPSEFRAVITPHRSLSPRALGWLMAVLAAAALVAATVFLLLGAWPVAGFMGAEIILAVLLLRLNAVRARASEVVVLDGAGVRVTRTDWRGRRQDCGLDSGWLRVELEERPGRAPVLALLARDRRLEIAADLNAEEKRDLAEALRNALHRQRHPEFDNPQLRT